MYRLEHKKMRVNGKQLTPDLEKWSWTLCRVNFLYFFTNAFVRMLPYFVGNWSLFWKQKETLAITWLVNCSNHLFTDSWSSRHQLGAQMKPPQLTFLWLPKTEKRLMNWKMEMDVSDRENNNVILPKRGAGKICKQYLKQIGE